MSLLSIFGLMGFILGVLNLAAIIKDSRDEARQNAELNELRSKLNGHIKAVNLLLISARHCLEKQNPEVLQDFDERVETELKLLDIGIEHLQRVRKVLEEE
jgi:hypothetical protein